MSRSAALVRARSLRESLLDHGVPRVSIEIQQGRPGTPHDRWYDDRFIGSMGHHIVSRRSQGLTPGLSLIKRGRIDVPGPLANGYGGFDRTARIICMGWANHPGAGGPYTLPSGRIPASNGRPYLFGWEHEGGLVLADWTDEFRSFMGSCHAGTLDWLGLRDTSHIEHKTWTNRKIDRLNYTLASARAEIRDNWEDDDMPLNSDDLNKIAERTAAVLRQHDGNSTGFEYNGRPLSRDEAMFRGAQFSGGSLNLLKYTVTKELAEIRAAAGGQPVDEEALAQRLATLLLPEVGDQIRAELADLDGVDEDVVAEKIVARVGAKLTAPDA